MPYSPSRNTVFIHVPKAAGTTSKAYLQRLADDWLPTRSAPWRPDAHVWPGIGAAHGSPKHMSANEVRHQLGDDTYDSAFSFAAVRNPYDRLLSFYSFIRNGPRSRLHFARSDVPHARAAARALSFDGFVGKAVRNRDRWGFLFAQWQYVSDPDMQPLVDVVLRHEEFEEGLKKLAAERGWPAPDLDVLGRRNASAGRDYRDYYSDRSRRLVDELMAADCELYGYRF